MFLLRSTVPLSIQRMKWVMKIIELGLGLPKRLLSKTDVGLEHTQQFFLG